MNRCFNRAILITLLIQLSWITMIMSAQSREDTLARTLNEVVVEADNQSISPQLSTYFPSKKQKNAASNATSLLAMMAIPQLDVEISSGTVKTLEGNSVAIYIDYVESSPNDLEGMKTTDVKRVEFYSYPTDPRFKGARYVINFIMQKYLYGGYTKLTAEEQFEVNRALGSVYSKMTYKTMLYDIYAGTSYLNTRHNGSQINETYRFTDLFGEGPKNVYRSSTTESSRLHNSKTDISFRVLYNKSNVSISNKISLVWNDKPVDESVSAVTYSPDIFMSQSGKQNNKTDNLTAGYNGNFFFRFSDKMSLQSDLIYTYGHNSSQLRYHYGEQFDITNDASETSNFIRINPRLSYRLNQKHNLAIFFTGAWNTHRIKYTGSSPSVEDYKIQAYFAGVHYDYISAKIQAGTDLGLSSEGNRISGIKSTNIFPSIVAYANYMPARKHMLSLSLNYGQDVPDASQKSPNMLQQNELMWYTGSPDLKDYSYLNGNLSYTWLPNNKWQFSATSTYSRFTNRCVAIYTPSAPQGTMLRHYVNGGDYSAGMLGVNATGRFFRGTLIINAMPQLWLYHTSGDYQANLNDINGRIQISYYPGNFYFTGSYTLQRKYPATQAEYHERIPAIYQLQAGWGNGNWNITLTAFNFFRNSWESSRQTLSSQWYDYNRINFSSAYHRYFEIGIRYTIGYGKKVDRRNEVSSGDEAKSAILK